MIACQRSELTHLRQVNVLLLHLLPYSFQRCAEHTYATCPKASCLFLTCMRLHSVYVCGFPPCFFFPKGKLWCSFSNSSWCRVNCNQLAGVLVQSKHLKRGDCTGRYPGALLAAWPPPSSRSPSLLYASFMRGSSDARRLSAMQLFVRVRPTMVRLLGLILRFAPPAPPPVVWPVSQPETSQTRTS